MEYKKYNRIFNGIKVLGIKRFIQISSITLMDYWFDFKYGTDTAGHVELNALEIDSSNWERGHRYAQTPGKALNKLMNILAFPHDSVFVDLGCGKGKVVLLASQYRFKRIAGIDFSKELCECAMKNISLYQKKREVKGRIEIINSDVVDYEIKNDDNIFYLFNPFDEVILDRVMANIAASLARKPRPIYLIYYNPVYGERIMQEKYFVRSNTYLLYGCEFVVYSNR